MTIWSTIRQAFSSPLARTIRRRKTSLIISRAGSTLILPSEGSTFSVTVTACPPVVNMRQASGAALALPATITGSFKSILLSVAALARIVSRLPPSVPPASRIISGFSARICAISDSPISYEKVRSTLAPAPKAAILAACAVSSGTRPTATMRKPPAALLQASFTL